MVESCFLAVWLFRSGNLYLKIVITCTVALPAIELFIVCQQSRQFTTKAAAYLWHQYHWWWLLLWKYSSECDVWWQNISTNLL